MASCSRGVPFRANLLINKYQNMSNHTKQSASHIIKQSPQPFPIYSTKIPSRQAIALISEHGDPAAEIGKDAAGGQNVYVRQVGEALAKLGWQVDMFTRKSHPTDDPIVQHSPTVGRSGW